MRRAGVQFISSDAGWILEKEKKDGELGKRLEHGWTKGFQFWIRGEEGLKRWEILRG